MKLKRLKLHNCLGILYGLGQETIEIDLTQFRTGLVLLQGKSGTGKSTILNNLHPYRTVGKDTFNKHFLPDGFRELEFEFRGNHYLSQIYVDKAQLFKNDILLNETQKVSTYDEIVENEIGNQDTFFDLLFAGRRFKNVLDMTKGEKKELVVDYLLSHLKKNEQYLVVCKNEQQELLDDQYKYRIKLESKEQIENEIKTIYEEKSLSTEKIKELEKKIKNVNEELEEQTHLQELYVEQEKNNSELKLKIKEEEGTLKTLVSTLDQEKREYNKLLDRYNSVKQKYSLLKEELTDIIKPNYTEEDVNQYLDQAYKDKEEEFGKYQISKHNKINLEEKLKRAKDDLANLKKSELPCDSKLQIKCPLTKNTDLTGMIKSKEKEVSELKEELGNFELYEYDVEDHDLAIAVLQTKLKALSEYSNNLEKLKRKEELQAEGKQLKSEKETMEADLPLLTEKVANQEKVIRNLIAGILDKYEDVSNMIKYHSERISEKKEELATRKEQARIFQEQIEQKKEELKKYKGYEEKILELEKQILEYDNLIKFFGKDGVMMYELELAGDEISKVANELLRNYRNKEIKIKFETMKPDSKGNLKDVFDIQCSINGGDWQTYLSDGESVLVSNSIREAMAYLKQNKEYETVFLDELDGRIDSESRVGFLKLLEQGNEMNGREHVYLISHSEEVKSYCDQSITLKDGELIITN